MNIIPFTGSGVAIITPFNEKGKINFDKLGELIEFQIANSTDAIIICGTTGESATMPDDEHLSAIQYTVEKVAGRIPVIAGAGSNDTYHGIHLSKKASKLGIDGILSVTPYYNKTTQKGLIKHYEAIAKEVDVPIILYNVPSRTGVNILPETLLELSKIDNIVAIKEASGNVQQVTKMAMLCEDKITIYSGDDDITVPLLSLGAKGVISVIANIMPLETHNMVAEYLNGNVEESRRIQLKLYKIVKAMFMEVNPIPVKTALNMMGYEVGGLRLPLCEMEESNAERLRQILNDYGLLKN